MKKVLLKIISIFIVISFLTINLFTINSNAGITIGPSPSDWSPMAGDTEESVQSVMATLINIIQIIGVGIAIIILVVVAIKYMTAAPEGKAEFKKSAMTYIIGAVVLFGVAGILGIIRTFSRNTLGTSWW